MAETLSKQFAKYSIKISLINVSSYKHFICYLMGAYALKKHICIKIAKFKKTDVLKKYTITIGLEHVNKKHRLFFVRPNFQHDDTFLVIDEKMKKNKYSLNELLYHYGIDDALSQSFLCVFLSNEAKIEDTKLVIDYFVNSFEKNKITHFITGAGVSFQYGGKSWKELIKSCGNSIHNLQPNMSIKKVKHSLFNTTYAIPQVLKDLDKSTFYSTVLSSLGKWIGPVDGSSLEAITDYFKRRKSTNNSILTFNYDELHEKSLQNKGLQINVCYMGKSDSKLKNGIQSIIQVIHPHGIFDKKKGYLVLTNDEYSTAYHNCNKNKAPGYLFKQLENPNIIIGNSISDYEEQKVISDSFCNRCPSFHLICIIEPKHLSDSTKLYENIFFLKMGIIPFWTKSKTEIVKFLNSF